MRETSATSTARWRRRSASTRSASCAPRITAGPSSGPRSAPARRRRRACWPWAISISRISAPGGTPKAGFAGASTTSTRPGGCPTRTTSCASRRARCWPSARRAISTPRRPRSRARSSPATRLGWRPARSRSCSRSGTRRSGRWPISARRSRRSSGPASTRIRDRARRRRACASCWPPRCPSAASRSNSCIARARGSAASAARAISRAPSGAAASSRTRPRRWCPRPRHGRRARVRRARAPRTCSTP